MKAAPGHDVLSTLLRNHERFLQFLTPRAGSRDEAEEILQAAFVKGVEKSSGVRDGESAVAWFYRLLRNALADHWRGRAKEKRAKRKLEAIGPGVTQKDDPLEKAVCRCIGDLLGTMKPEYGALIREVDLGGRSLGEVARVLGITVNNATVRLYRARKALHSALRKSCGTCTEHGCLECHCKD